MSVAVDPYAFPAGADNPVQVDLNKELVRHPRSTFLVECSGDSMISAFIPPKAKLLIDRALQPRNGDIILAMVHGELTVKFLRKNEFKCWLVPANSKYREVEVTPEMNLQVWGVVIAVISETSDLRRCMF
jgi:DNA polymerase V